MWNTPNFHGLVFAPINQKFNQNSESTMRTTFSYHYYTFRTMSGLKLTVVMPSKHRISVKVSSKETLLRQVLEDACIKKSLNPDDYLLRRNNKVK